MASLTTNDAVCDRNPHAPEGLQRLGARAVLPLLDDAFTSPASRRLAAHPEALATRPSRVYLRPARLGR